MRVGGGEEASQGVIRLESVLAERQPNTVFFLEGTNDLIKDVSQSTILSNIETAVEKVKDSGAEFVLLGLPPTDKPALNETITDFNQKLRELADKEGIVFVDSYDCFFVSHCAPESFGKIKLLKDDLHPSESGYRVLANCIKSALGSN